MLKKIDESKILFLDIETVSETKYYDDISPELQELWAKKTAYRREKEEIPPDEFYVQSAGIWAEFGKIVCISCGFIKGLEEFRLKSFHGHNEVKILEGFSALLQKYYSRPQSILCAHNGKEFDFPYLARRYVINQMEIPNILQLQGKKPWEIPHLDTMELWKFGDYKHYTSLNLLANILNIPTPKDDIDGSQVAEVYYKENDVERIKNYCEKDVLTVAQIFRRFKNETLLKLED